MSIGVLLRGFIGDMMDFGDVILRTFFPSFMTIQACSCIEYMYRLHSGSLEARVEPPTQARQQARHLRNGHMMRC